MKSLLSAPRVMVSLAIAVFALLVALGIWGVTLEYQVLMLALLAMTMLGGLVAPAWSAAIATLCATLVLYFLVRVSIGTTSLLSMENVLGASTLVLAAIVAWAFSRQIQINEQQSARQGELVDALTIYDQESGAIRGGHMVEVLNYEVARARRYHEQITIAAVQLQQAPGYGGPSILEVRRKLSALFIAKLRNVDRVGYSADMECLLILPNTAQDQADIVAGRLVHLAREQLSLDIVIGLATFPDDGTGAEALLHEAKSAVEFGRMNTLPVVSPRLFGLETMEQ